MFKFLWLRRFVRRYSSPIPEDSAHFWKQRISIVYMILAWNAMGFVGYAIYSGKADWAKEFKSPTYLKMTPAQQWTSTLGIEKAKVIRVSGLNIDAYEIDNSIAVEQKQQQ